MPTLELDATTIRYEVTGPRDRTSMAPPILMLAPGGLRASRIETWGNAPWNPIDALSDRYQVVAMDQRNTGTSFGPISAADGWDTYAADQLAVMDHLGIGRFAVCGMCIGGAFILRLLATAPERVSAAVAMQPIGQDGNADEFRAIFDDWRSQIGADHPEADDDDWAGCFANLFETDRRLWSVDDDVIASLSTPLLVLRGNDVYHPASASEHLAATAPGATLVERWKEPEDQPAARAAVDAFLADHA